jgi:flotillin
MQVRLTTVKLEVSRLNKDALITLDKLRVDVVGLFHIKVKPDAQSIAAAAQTLGESVNSPDAVKSLLDGKLVSALRSVAATMTMEHLHANRADFIQKVQEALMTDLDMNGFQLESVSITHFDQTAFEHFNENNAFDAEGLTVLTRTIEERKKIRNDIVATNRVEIEQRNLDANNQSLEIAQAAEQARLTQEQTLAARRAEQATAIATAEAEQTRLAEIARITAEQAQTVARPRPTRSSRPRRSCATARSRPPTIERDRNIELARITTAVQTAQKSEEESTATAAANEARALAVRAEESVATAKATEIANRNKNVAVIAATQRAQEEAVGITVAATRREGSGRGPRHRAAHRGDRRRRCRKGPRRGPRRRVQGRCRRPDRAQRSDQRPERRADRAAGAQGMLEALPAIIAAASKPMEQIDKISILDARGLHGDAGGRRRRRWRQPRRRRGGRRDALPRRRPADRCADGRTRHGGGSLNGLLTAATMVRSASRPGSKSRAPKARRLRPNPQVSSPHRLFPTRRPRHPRWMPI